ncbi:hypothetical protein [Sphingomonas aerolata]|uniref:hypothetical protein n=1 Tax=Sphingomonas aerolata TaxID=185951 RepID=UPI002FDF3A34
MADRKDVMAERLREARVQAGYASAAAAAAAFGFGVSTLTSHENGTRGYDIDAAVRYGRAFKVNPGRLLGLDTIDTPAFRMPREPASKMIEVIGAVEAGVWRERTEWPESERYEIEAGHSVVPNVERFGLVVEGYSMDKVFPRFRTGMYSRLQGAAGAARWRFSHRRTPSARSARDHV